MALFDYETSPGHFWMLRHGERIDETDAAKEWKHGVPRERRFDPPLTSEGRRQARLVGGVLGGRGFQRVYSSPMQRCLETAQEVAILLGVPVTVVPGLAECAAAARKNGLGHLQLLDRDAMLRVCPSIEFEFADTFEDAPATFEAACAWLARAPGPVLAVSHREGIRELAHEHLKLPYCAFARFQYHGAHDHFAWSLRALFGNTGDLLVARSTPPPNRDDFSLCSDDSHCDSSHCDSHLRLSDDSGAPYRLGDDGRLDEPLCGIEPLGCVVEPLDEPPLYRIEESDESDEPCAEPILRRRTVPC